MEIDNAKETIVPVSFAPLFGISLLQTTYISLYCENDDLDEVYTRKLGENL